MSDLSIVIVDSFILKFGTVIVVMNISIINARLFVEKINISMFNWRRSRTYLKKCLKTILSLHKNNIRDAEIIKYILINVPNPYRFMQYSTFTKINDINDIIVPILL